MTLPSVIRIFFAIDLPAPVKEKLGHYIGGLKKKAKSNAIRWTKPENLHITLQFLAEVQTEHLTKLIENVRTELSGKSKNIALTLGEIHLFPNPYRPRVIVLEINPQEELGKLAGLIGDGIKTLSYEVDSRPFRAHLTLGRIKRTGINLNFLTDVEEPVFENINLNEVILFRSEPQPEGSKYTVLERIIL